MDMRNEIRVGDEVVAIDCFWDGPIRGKVESIADDKCVIVWGRCQNRSTFEVERVIGRRMPHAELQRTVEQFTRLLKEWSDNVCQYIEEVYEP